MRFLAAIAALFLLSAPAEAGAPNIRIIETGPSQFRVEYRMESPARALYFSRNADGFRKERWRNPDAVIVHRADAPSRVERKDGAAFSILAFDVDGRPFDGVARDYAPFTPFSDGGVLLYSGYFHACADAPCDSEATWSVEAETARRRRVVVGGGDARARISFRDRADGAFIYMGRARMIEVGGARAVFDQNAPLAIKRAFRAATPRLRDWFDRTLGASSLTPVFYISTAPSPRSEGFESRGAAVGQGVSIHLSGAGWRAGEAPEPGFLPWYFAHEIAHLYQRVGDRPISDAFMREAWVQEGGAEALAALALRDTFPELADYVDARVARAVDACATALAVARSGGSGGDQSADSSYSCGLALQMAIDADLRRNSGGDRSLVDAWALFLDRTSKGARWSSEEFLRSARLVGASDEALGLVASVSREPGPPAATALLKSRVVPTR